MPADTTPLGSLAMAAQAAAARHKNPVVRPAHLLWALCRTEEGRRAVEEREGDYPAVLRMLAERFRAESDPTTGSPRVSQEFQDLLGHLAEFTASGPLEARPIKPTIGLILDGMIAVCALHADMFPALVQGCLVEQVRELGMAEAETSPTPFDPFDAPCTDMPDDDHCEEDDSDEGMDSDSDGADARDASALHVQDPNMAAALAAMRNISNEAHHQQLDPVVGRAREIAEVRAVLERRRKPNVLLVGEPGVGKTALVEGLASDLADNPGTSPLQGRPVIEVQMGALVSGTRFRGDFEARMRYVLENAQRRRAILFIDEAHALMGAGGSTTSGGMDAATLLKPMLARGDIALILATTPSESRILVKDKAFARRFQRVGVKEPTARETETILLHAKGGYEEHHGVQVPAALLAGMVDAVDSAAPERRFPDKAFDVLDATAAATRARGAEEATYEDVQAAILATTGTRIGRPLPEDVARAQGLEEALKDAVLGQDAAVQTLARSVRLCLLGLGQMGCASAHLFNGPSGVGKTETAKALAKALAVPLVRIDMSEFMDPHAIAGLIGAPPGYVGFQEDGLLIAAAEAHPKMVLLLDEVDKAHPRVFDLLLQVMDAGRLTSPDGRVVSFRGTHLLMTANLGAQEAERPAFGFGRTRDGEDAMREAVAAHFRPEFAGRLTTVINFAPIQHEVARLLAQRALDVMIDRFARSGVTMTVSDGVAGAIVEGLPDGPVSGRRIARAVEERVADAIALDAFARTGPLRIVLDGEKATLEAA